MFIKENLLPVPGLNAGKISAMSDGQFTNYSKTLNTFIDSFPGKADKMRTASDNQDYKELEKTLSEFCNLLEIIFASGLAQDAKRQIHALQKGNADPDAVEAFIEKFILNVSSLSIDIQMSARKSAPAPRKPAESSQVKQIFSAGSAGGGNPFILAVDNAVMFLNTLQKLLQGAPYDLHCVTSANEVLDFVGKGTRVDLFLIDIEMPGMDGYELARRLRGSGQKAPIVFVTANAAREYIDKAVGVGADGLLMKPLRGNQLLEKIKQLI
ncbi:MAG: response regulator [Oscillospiraceae bacterium]|nr:response regulator [Oscillospiraceae bacterium]